MGEMSLVDGHIEELKAALWRGLPAARARWGALFEADPDGFLAAARRAMEGHDNLTLIAMGEALDARGQLLARPLRKLGFVGALAPALVEEQRFEEALALLQRPEIANPGHHKHWIHMAEALAGAGRLKEAHLAVRQALALKPGHREAAALEAELRPAIELRRWFKDGGFGWSELRRLIQALQALGARQRAAKFLKARLKPFPAIPFEQLQDALEVLEIAAELRGPEAGLAYALAAKPYAGRSRRLRALVSRCLIGLGRAAEALQDDGDGRVLRREHALALAHCGELDLAIERLGRMTEEGRKDAVARAGLAWCVGAHVLREAPLVFGPAAPRPRIFNLMPFNDELDLLELHLAEMAEWVDLFVIVESTVTFTGLPKPLHFEAAKARFSAYADRIRHVVVEGHPAAFSSPWSRDFRQRDLAVPALSGLCAPDDLVLLTDVDEVVDRRALDGFDGEFAGMLMEMFRYFLNYRPIAEHSRWRPTGAVFRARWLQRFGSSYARFFLSRRKDGRVLARAGWHFTSVADPRRLVAKINSYAHQERQAVWRDEDAVGRLLADIRSGKLEEGWERAEIGDGFPRYLREHQEALRALMI